MRRAPQHEPGTGPRATRPVFFESMFDSARLPVVSGCPAGRTPFYASSLKVRRDVEFDTLHDLAVAEDHPMHESIRKKIIDPLRSVGRTKRPIGLSQLA
jgi:hypothetical protein